MDWLIGAAGALIVAGAAYRKRSLSESGAAAAILMGTIYYGAGNVFWFGTLLFHYIHTVIPVREAAEGRPREILCQDRASGCGPGLRQWRHRHGAVSVKRMDSVRSVGIPVYRRYGYGNGGYLGHGVRQP